jgi:flagellar basal body-associated protein FliL
MSDKKPDTKSDIIFIILCLIVAGAVSVMAFTFFYLVIVLGY